MRKRGGEVLRGRGQALADGAARLVLAKNKRKRLGGEKLPDQWPGVAEPSSRCGTPPWRKGFALPNAVTSLNRGGRTLERWRAIDKDDSNG